MEPTEQERATIYAALRAWKALRGKGRIEASAIKSWNDIATNGGELKPMTDDEIEALLGNLVGDITKPKKPFEKLKIVKWLDAGEIILGDTKGIKTIGDLLEAAGNALDGASLAEVIVFRAEDGIYYQGSVEFIVDPADEEHVREIEENFGKADEQGEDEEENDG